jgi:hypothetical protein
MRVGGKVSRWSHKPEERDSISRPASSRTLELKEPIQQQKILRVARIAHRKTNVEELAKLGFLMLRLPRKLI